MKKIALLLTFMICFYILNAQKTSPVKIDSSQMAKIVFDKTDYDYGTIAQGSQPIALFPFTNKGKSPLIIKSIKAACGCTTTSWTREPIGPGKSGSIKVKFDTNHEKFFGPFMRTVTVISNAADSSIVLQINGVIK